MNVHTDEVTPTPTVRIRLYFARAPSPRSEDVIIECPLKLQGGSL